MVPCGIFLRAIPALRGTMASRRAKVQFVGLVPAVLKPCGPACAQPFTDRAVRALADEEWEETPVHMRENADRAHALAERLHRDFGAAIEIEVVGLDSPRGLWLGLRHRIGKGFAMIVDGREVVRGPSGYDEVKGPVERAVRARGAIPAP